MASILIGLFTFVLVLVCVLLVLVILMQRPNANAGMGAALGGGMAEGAFGGEAGNVLTKATVKLTVLYFVISAGLYLGYIYTTGGSSAEKAETPSISSLVEQKKAEAEKAPAPKADAAKEAALEPGLDFILGSLHNLQKNRECKNVFQNFGARLLASRSFLSRYSRACPTRRRR